MSTPLPNRAPAALRLLGLLLRREVRLAAGRPGPWLVTAGYLLACGLFLLLRLAAGEGGDQGGYFREVGAVLLPAAALLGAAALAPSPRRRAYRVAPIPGGVEALGLLAPVFLQATSLAFLGAWLPVVSAPGAPLDYGVLLAGSLSLAVVGVAVASLGALGGACLGHSGAGALAGFLVALSMWGAGGLGVALGFPWLGLLDLGAGLPLAGEGWFSLRAAAPAWFAIVLSVTGIHECLGSERL